MPNERKEGNVQGGYDDSGEGPHSDRKEGPQYRKEYEHTSVEFAWNRDRKHGRRFQVDLITLTYFASR